ncbi:MAG: hypothetical protein Q7J34_01645, partial [Bacteroidales bacterium]|nr:hypothetical protein [Bacteroidales bacterium]
GFMFIAYNLRRLINILGKEGIKAYLKVLSVHILAFISHLIAISGVKMHHQKISGISHQFLFYFQKTAYI